MLCRKSTENTMSCSALSCDTDRIEQHGPTAKPVRTPLMPQSAAFEQWQGSSQKSGAHEQCIEDTHVTHSPVEKWETETKLKLSEAMHVSDEEMQDVSVMAEHQLFTDMDMSQWWQSDPLMEVKSVNIPSRPVGLSSEAEFFNVQKKDSQKILGSIWKCCSKVWI